MSEHGEQRLGEGYQRSALSGEADSHRPGNGHHRDGARRRLQSLRAGAARGRAQTEPLRNADEEQDFRRAGLEARVGDATVSTAGAFAAPARSIRTRSRTAT